MSIEQGDIVKMNGHNPYAGLYLCLGVEGSLYEMFRLTGESKYKRYIFSPASPNWTVPTHVDIKTPLSRNPTLDEVVTAAPELAEVLVSLKEGSSC